jgi:putative methionine-R-sulfoxide reductase with GAF domain
MSTDDLSRKGQDILQIVGKAKEFTEELLKENERLRFKIASLEAGGGGQGSDERVKTLDRRVRDLEDKLAEVEARYRKVEEENKEFADRYIEIEEQNNNLANLYVASYQLHSTLDFKEVVRIVQEIVINLIGAEVFHILMVSEKTGQLEVEASEGQTPGRTTIPIGDGLIGKAAQSGENYFAESVARRDPSPYEEPLAVIPLKIKDSTIGVISINKLLVQKTAFTSMDYELFTLLAGHAATAVFSAKLYSTSTRKLSTLQGFLDMLKQKYGLDRSQTEVRP